MLQSMGSQRAGHHLPTEQPQDKINAGDSCRSYQLQDHPSGQRGPCPATSRTTYIVYKLSALYAEEPAALDWPVSGGNCSMCTGETDGLAVPSVCQAVGHKSCRLLAPRSQLTVLTSVITFRAT